MKIYGLLHFKLLSYLESKIIEASDLTIFVSEETVDLVMRKYPKKWRQKTIVIPHCYEKAEYEELLRDDNKINHLKRDGKIVFTYVGTFYGERTPACLIEVLSMIKSSEKNDHLDRILIRIIGKMQSEYQRIFTKEFPDTVELIGTVEHKKALEYMLSSDYLLLVDAPTDELSLFFPSKLVEYIGANRPIIGITPLNGCSARIIRNLGYPVVSPNDSEVLFSLFSDILNGRKTFSGNIKYSQQFDCDAVSKQFISALQETIANRQNG